MEGKGAHLLELDDVGMQQAAVVLNLPLHIHAGELLAPLHELDGHLQGRTAEFGQVLGSYQPMATATIRRTGARL